MLAGLGLAYVAGGRARAAVISVNTFDDDNSLNGNCTLREAILAANIDRAVDGCLAGSGADTILLPEGTYPLSLAGANEDAGFTGDLNINSSLTIRANEGYAVVDGKGLDRVFEVRGGSTVLFENLEIKGGSASIYSSNLTVEDGDVTLKYSRVTGGTGASGIYVYNTSGAYTSRLTLIGSRVSANIGRNGGAIANYSTTILINSLVDGNEAEHFGGGIVNYRSLSLINSTVTGNSAREHGGGILNYGEAGLYNATIVDNTADIDGDDMGNGGGLYTSPAGTTTAKNTLIALNSDESPTGGEQHPDCSGSFDSAGYNLLDVKYSCTLSGDETGNLYNRYPFLDELSENGGPTPSHALLSVSPAIDAGAPSGCLDPDGKSLTTDQRGYTRANRCDIGAYEYGSPGAPTATTDVNTATVTATYTPSPSPSPTSFPGGPIRVNTTVDTVDSSGDCSLREAILAANQDIAVDGCIAGEEEDTILLPAGVYNLELLGPWEDEGLTGDLDITGELELIGEGMETTFINANSIDRVLHILNDSPVEISGLTLTGGYTLFAITAQGSDPAAASGQEASTVQTSLGSGVYIEDGFLWLVSTRISSNHIGGGILVGNGSNLQLHESYLENNLNELAPGGGLIVEAGGIANVLQSTIKDNRAVGSGGGAANSGFLALLNSTVSGNTAGRHGGGFLNRGITLLFNITISGNTAGADVQRTGDGGGIHQVEGTFLLRNSLVAGNYDLSQTGDTEPDCSGTLTGDGYNLVQDPAGCSFTGSTEGNLLSVDPLLGPLQDNGGPTWTHALLAGSPAIDAGNPDGCFLREGGPQGLDILIQYDQRLYDRPADGDNDGTPVCDIGAFEYGSSSVPGTATPTTEPTPSGTPPAPGSQSLGGPYLPLILSQDEN